MNKENRSLLVATNEPAGFEEYPVQIQDFRKISNQFRVIYRIFFDLIKWFIKTSTCNRLISETLGSRPIMFQNLPGHWSVALDRENLRDPIANQSAICDYSTRYSIHICDLPLPNWQCNLGRVFLLFSSFLVEICRCCKWNSLQGVHWKFWR